MEITTPALLATITVLSVLKLMEIALPVTILSFCNPIRLPVSMTVPMDTIKTQIPEPVLPVKINAKRV